MVILQKYFYLAYDDTWINRKSWFNRYGRKNGFICYLMRYFLQLNWRRNLHISENEYLALMALVFGRPDAHFFQKLAIRPTTRCITIGNWFQVGTCASGLFSVFFENGSWSPLVSEIYWHKPKDREFFKCQISEILLELA